MEDFLQHTINGLNLGSIYALIAIGYTMVYGILQMINFAHSDIYMVGAFAAYYLNRFFGLDATPGWLSFTLSLLFSMLVCSLLAIVIERWAYRPLRHAPKLNILITAIGVSLFLEYAGQVVFGADPKVFPQLLNDEVLFHISSVEVRVLDVVVFSVSLIAMFALNFLIYRTKAGKAMRAVSQNPQVAALMGINIDRTITLTFIVGSALAGVGSVLVGVKYPRIEPLMGMMIGLKAFVAAVLGGIGSLPGAILGGLIMGVSEAFVVAYFSSTYRDALAFGILILILLVKPAGLFGKYRVEKV